MDSVLDFIKSVLLSTANQIFLIFGLLFLFGLFLYLFSRFTRITYSKSVGSRVDVIFTGWIGTPVHELGHALFCLIFRHKIMDIKLYTPNSTDGTLGYVSHRYNKNSIFQRIGNFFIGVGPIIFGSLVLYLVFYFLVPNKQDIFLVINKNNQVLADIKGYEYAEIIKTLWNTITLTVLQLFSSENLSDYRFWIFLYLAICISSHIELSPSDIKGAATGFVSLIILILIINIIVTGMEMLSLNEYFGDSWRYFKIESYSVNIFSGFFGSILFFASIMSVMNFLLSYILFSIYNLISRREFINPAW